MILLNQHLEKGKSYESNREMFPKLYWKNLNGEYERYKDISIEFVNGNWEIQTDVNNSKWIQTKLEEYLTKEKEKCEKQIEEATTKLKAIERVMPTV